MTKNVSPLWARADEIWLLVPRRLSGVEPTKNVEKQTYDATVPWGTAVVADGAQWWEQEGHQEKKCERKN